jgi:cell division protein FtsB
VAFSGWWRRARRQFGISAPRMAVRTRLPWWGRSGAVVLTVAFVAGLAWWGYDFGLLFSGANRREIQARVATLEAENADQRSEAAALRARNSQLESELAMARGAKDAVARQAADLSTENAALKEQAAFLQELLADSNQPAGMSIPRLTLERQSDTLWRYSLLIVRGGKPRDEFTGRLVLQATLQEAAAAGSDAKTLTLPDDQPDVAPLLKLAFKYYQRVEGTFRVPPDTRVTALEARAFEGASGSPRASRSVQYGLTTPGDGPKL